MSEIHRVISENSDIGEQQQQQQPQEASQTRTTATDYQQMEIDNAEDDYELQQHPQPNTATATARNDNSNSLPPHTIIMEEEDESNHLNHYFHPDRTGETTVPVDMIDPNHGNNSSNNNMNHNHNTTTTTPSGTGTGEGAASETGGGVVGHPSDTSSSLSDGSMEQNRGSVLAMIENEDMDMLDRTMEEEDDHGHESPQQQQYRAAAVIAPHSSAPAASRDTRTMVVADPSQASASNSMHSNANNPNPSSASSQQPQSPQNYAQQQQQTGLFQRMDSATNESSNDGGSTGSHRNGASSQTSSRDWGWFEDVHMGPDHTAGSGVALMMGAPPSSSNSLSLVSPRGGGRGGGGAGGSNGHKLLTAPTTPQDMIHTNDVDDEAAAMAVTAPTYVLEESLSSQKLWKHTAGNRPPQPMEERAFFEKMWAQNFARSQVNYSMPVEVLTASSPISLNPFADGVFEGAGVSEGPHQIVADYGHYGTTTGAGSSQTPSDSVEGDAAAQAALISRMHDMTEDGLRSSATYIGNQKQIYQKVPGSKSDGDLTVLLRGPNAFGTTVSKSFARSTDNGNTVLGVDTVNISLASYRVVESKKYGKYAQFLVIYREGSIRDTVGVWKRYRDFEELSHKVTQAHEGCAAVIANMSPLAMTEEPDTEHLPNAITSWRLLKKRKRWYRCLDAGYLSLKVFLLERFLHDILFESSSPKLLRDFVLGSSGGAAHGPR